MGALAVIAASAAAAATVAPRAPTKASGVAVARPSLLCRAALTSRAGGGAYSRLAARRQDRPSGSRLAITRSSSKKVVAGWGDPVDWQGATVVKVEKASSQIYSLTIDVGAVSKGYVKAGQYVQAKVGDSKPGFFAIASAPNSDANSKGQLQLLIKSQGGTAELLCNMSAGSKLEVSPVMGKGFPVENIQPTDQCPNVYLFATGSGISPVKALIESGTLEADKRSGVTLFFGARDSEAMACQELFGAWQKLGVKVVPVLSSEGKGYVQDVFASTVSGVDGKATGAVLCGQKEMATAIREALEGEGVPKERILTNF